MIQLLKRQVSRCCDKTGVMATCNSWISFMQSSLALLSIISKICTFLSATVRSSWMALALYTTLNCPFPIFLSMLNPVRAPYGESADVRSSNSDGSASLSPILTVRVVQLTFIHIQVFNSLCSSSFLQDNLKLLIMLNFLQIRFI